MEPPRPLDDPLGAVMERDDAPGTAPASPSLQRTAVLVAGIAGSGAPTLARMLALLGCDLVHEGADALPDPVAALHREIYDAAGAGWDDWLPLEELWQTSPGALRFRERALEILGEEFASSPFFVLEAPRLSTLLRLWLDAVEAFDAVPHVVVPIGNPWRSAGPEGEEHAERSESEQLVWLRQLLEAEAASRLVPRSFVRDEDLFGRWEYVVARLGDDLSLAWPRWSPSVEAELERLLSPLGADRETPRRPRGAASWVDRAYEIVTRWARGEVRDSDTAVLDDIRASFDAGAPAFAAPIREAVTTAETTRAELEESASELEQARARLSELEASLSEAQADREKLARAIADESTLAAAAAERTARLEAQLREREAELERARRTPELEPEPAVSVEPAEPASAGARQPAFPQPVPLQILDPPDRATLAAFAAMRGLRPDDLERDLKERAASIKDRLRNGRLGELVAHAAQLDPLVDRGWRAPAARIAPFHSQQELAQLVALDALQAQAGRRRARAVIVVSKDRWGGAPRIEGHIAAALASAWGGEELVVVKTDEVTQPSIERFPPGCRHVDFAGLTLELEHERRQKLLVDFLRSLCPEHVFSVNSRLFSHTLDLYGRALSNSTRLYTCVFCNDQNDRGHRFGYPSNFFYRQFDFLAALVADSEYLADELRTTFCVPPADEDRVVTLHTPLVEPPRHAAAPPASPSRRRQVFWSGRFDRQKRVDVVFRLARLLPEVDFRLWGEIVLDGAGTDGGLPENVSLEGKYGRFEDLPLEACDIWLYTSQWDGVPNVLLEAAAAGLPLVASLVEGTTDVLVEGLCERIPDIEDVEAFRAAIERVLADPEGARERAGRLRELTIATRTTQRFRDEVLALVGAA